MNNNPEQTTKNLLLHPQVKICGLTAPQQACDCVEAGANAIGLVFFEKSPRNVSVKTARSICSALPPKILKIGVVVNESYDRLMTLADSAGLTAFQLHGQESPKLAKQLRQNGLKVFKALFVNGAPSLQDAERYDASAFLIECANGPLPGGNAMTWNWNDASQFAERYPTILAGGLSPENVCDAICSSLPDAVDVSSGVESSPGQKDIDKVNRFIKAVSRCATKFNLHTRTLRQVLVS